MCKPNHFDPDDFTRFVEVRPAYGQPVNSAMYHLFRNDQEHCDINVTEEKIKVLERLYSTHLSAYLGKQGVRLKNQTPQQWLACKLRKSTDFSRLIRRASCRITLSANTRCAIAQDVEDFVKLVQKFAGAKSGNGPISFCSKYLHFHTGVHPIYDRDVRSVLYLLDNCGNWRTKIKNRAKKKHPWAQKKMTYDKLCRLELGALKSAYPRRRVFGCEIRVLDHYLLARYRKQWSPS